MTEEEKKPEPKPLEIPDEAKAMAGQIINEAIKLIPNAPPSMNAASGADYTAVLRKLDTIEKNLYVVFCITEKILGQLVDPDSLKKMGVDVDRKVIKKRSGKE